MKIYATTGDSDVLETLQQIVGKDIWVRAYLNIPVDRYNITLPGKLGETGLKRRDIYGHCYIQVLSLTTINNSCKVYVLPFYEIDSQAPELDYILLELLDNFMTTPITLNIGEIKFYNRCGFAGEIVTTEDIKDVFGI